MSGPAASSLAHPFAGLSARRARLAGMVPVRPSALIAFSAAAVGAGLGRALLTTYLPVLLERIQNAPGLIGTVMLVNAAAGFLVPLLVGVWSDRLRDRGHGRTIPFVFGGSVVAAGGLAAVALGNSSSYLLLALFGAIAYTGLNAVTTGHRALIPENFDEDQRAAATGGEELAMLLGTLLGVAVGGTLIEVEGWAPFVLGAVLLPLLAWPTVRRMRGRERLRVNHERGPHRGAGYYLRAASIPGGRLILGAQALWVLGYVGLPPFFILYAEHELSLRPRSAGLMLAAFGILTGLTMLAAGVTKARRERPMLLVGAAAMGAGLLVVASSGSTALVAVALAPVAIGFGLLTTLGFPAFSSFIPRGEEGAYSALYFSVRAIAAAVALPAAGWTIAITDSYRALFVFGGIATLLALAPLFALPSGGGGGGEGDPDSPRRRLRWPGGEPPWRGSTPVRWAWWLAVLVALTLVVLAAGALVQRTEALLELDREVFLLLDGLGSSPRWLDSLVVDPHIQNYALLTLIAALAARRWRPGQVLRTAAAVAVAGVVAYAMVQLCWALWDRPRPEELLGIAPANDHSFSSLASFPSGHVAVTTAIAAAMASLLPALRYPLWAYVGLIALTRVTFGAHFPTDVLSGLAIGAASGWAVVAAAGGWSPRAALPRREDLIRLERDPAALRWVARGLSLFALAVFGLLLATEGAPASPDGGVLGASVEQNAQVAFLCLAAVGTAAAWYRDAFGGILLVAAVGLGSLAALEYTTLFALLAFLGFAVPGALFLLAWPWARATRRHLAAVGAAFALAMAAGGAGALAAYDAAYGPAHPQSSLEAPDTWRVQWIWSGGVSDSGATVTARLNADADTRLLVGRDPELADAVGTPGERADEDDDRIVSFALDGLTPGTRYWYGVEVDGELDDDRIGTFRTFERGPQSFKLAFAACARVGSNGAVFDAIREENPDLYMVTGDMFYANIEENAPGLFLDQFDRSLDTPAQGALYRSTPIAYVWDDHDFAGDGSDSTFESAPAAKTAYREAVPHYPLETGPDGAIYQAFDVGRVRFLMMDTRSERVPGDDPTMLGEEQLAWLKRELLASAKTHPMTVLVSSVPWIDDDVPGEDTWGGYADERAELSRFIAKHRIPGVTMLAGDAHMLAIDDGTNSDYSGTGRAGFPVAHAAALDRPGSEKGGPFSEGAYPGSGQYATMTVEDLGKSLEVTIVGKDWTGREIVRYSYSVPAP